jgi:hypothetical protein
MRILEVNSDGAFCAHFSQDFGFATAEAWIPDTLRFASLAHEVGNDAFHLPSAPVTNFGD